MAISEWSENERQPYYSSSSYLRLAPYTWHLEIFDKNY